MIQSRVYKNFDKINLPGLIMIGNFDGVHLGHQKIIQEAKKLASHNNYSFYVLTFNPHPKVFLKNKNLEHHFLLQSYDFKNNELVKLGVDGIIEKEFNKNIQELTGAQFLDDLFSNQNIKGIIVGHDTVIGKGREYSTVEIEDYCKAKKKQFFLLDKYSFENEVVNSSLIRNCLDRGEIEKVNKFLGHIFEVSGEVKKFKELGRTENAATANFNYPYYQKVPRLGVYFTNCTFNEKSYPSISNIGINPTIDQLDVVRIETHLLGDIQIDLYDKNITIELLKFHRDEKKFDSKEELFKQIRIDILEAKKYHNIL